MFLNLVLVSFLKKAANTPSEVTTPTPRHINIANNHASLQTIVKLAIGSRGRIELMKVMKTHKLITVI